MAKAWAPIQHVRDLFAGPTRIIHTGNFAALDGLRALLSLWMIMFHSFVYSTTFFHDADSNRLWRDPQLLPLTSGILAVDGFFILTGYLLLVPVFQESVDNASKDSAKSNFSVGTWWYRRLARTLPVYIFAILFKW